MAILFQIVPVRGVRVSNSVRDEKSYTAVKTHAVISASRSGGNDVQSIRKIHLELFHPGPEGLR